MDWFLIWVGYTLIALSIFKTGNFWPTLFNMGTFIADATLVTVQILTHLGVV